MAGTLTLGNNLISGAASKRENGVTTYYPNIELLYGPYDSTTAAYTALQAATGGLVVGRVVGVYNADKTKITEYWLSGGTAQANLVEKMPAAGGKIDAVKVNGTALSINASDKSVNIPLAGNSTNGVVQPSEASLAGKQMKTYVDADGKLYADVPTASDGAFGVVKTNTKNAQGFTSVAALDFTQCCSKMPVIMDGEKLYTVIPWAAWLSLHKNETYGTNNEHRKGTILGLINGDQYAHLKEAADKVLGGQAFSTSKDYSAGELVVYSDVLYRFTKDHAVGVAWIGTEGDNADVVVVNDFVNIKQECLDAVDERLQELDDYIAEIAG